MPTLSGGAARRLLGRSLPLIAAVALAAPALAGPAPYPLGVYAYNPDGSSRSAELAFESQFNSFVTTMNGARPQFMNAFINFSQPASTWAANAGWTAWSWTQSPVVGTAITPVIGIPMSDNNHWAGNGPGWTNDDFFRQIVAGTYDSAYQGIVDSWVKAGFKTLYLRLGYEMDGQFMPWFMGSDPGTQADWVAAFRHLSTLMRNEAANDHATAYSVWNPDDIGWTQLPVVNAYPGDAFVDVISSDAYSPMYPSTLYDWGRGNWIFDSSIQQWWASPVDRMHYWTWPSSSPWNPHGTGSGWGFQDTIALAKAHHKAIAVSETGAGGDGTSTGPVDESVFPHWLANELWTAQQQGVKVAYVNIWDVWMQDGHWSFSHPSDGKPLEAAAWALWFGASYN